MWSPIGSWFSPSVSMWCFWALSIGRVRVGKCRVIWPWLLSVHQVVTASSGWAHFRAVHHFSYSTLDATFDFGSVVQLVSVQLSQSCVNVNSNKNRSSMLRIFKERLSVSYCYLRFATKKRLSLFFVLYTVIFCTMWFASMLRNVIALLSVQLQKMMINGWWWLNVVGHWCIKWLIIIG